MKKVFAVVAIMMASSTVFASSEVDCIGGLNRLIAEARQTAMVESQLITASNAKIEDVVRAIEVKNAKLEEAKANFILNGCLNAQ